MQKEASTPSVTSQNDHAFMLQRAKAVAVEQQQQKMKKKKKKQKEEVKDFLLRSSRL